MQEYIEFAGRHVLLFVALGSVIALIIMTELKRLTKGYKEVLPAEAVRLINKEDALVLDVREANELGQGTIIDSKHIALGALSDKISSLPSDKDKPIVVFCKMGNRSAQAAKLLLKNSYTNVFAMKGGLTAWINEQLPVTKNKTKNNMSTPEVTIYTGHRCAYCNAAKKMLDSKNVSYNEINIHEDPSKMEEMVTRTNRQTVPQIFIGEFHVGGFDDMAELNGEGKLDDLLQGEE